MKRALRDPRVTQNQACSGNRLSPPLLTTSIVSGTITVSVLIDTIGHLNTTEGKYKNNCYYSAIFIYLYLGVNKDKLKETPELGSAVRRKCSL